MPVRPEFFAKQENQREEKAGDECPDDFQASFCIDLTEGTCPENNAHEHGNTKEPDQGGDDKG